MAEVNFTLVQLRYFVAAAERGSMTAAARDLVVSQSAISSAIAQLERELGVQLLVRHHAKGLSPTRAGERFLGEARDLLAHAGDLVESARGLGAALTGELAIGFFVTLAPFHLPGLLAECAARHPGLRVGVTEGEIAAVQAALLDGRCELALLYDIDLAAELRTEVLDRAPPHVLLPPGHPLAAGETVALADLAGEPMVLLDLPHSRDYFRSLFTRVGVRPTVRFRTPGYETVRAMVAAGHGYSILNQRPRAAETYAGGRVAVRPIREELPALPVVLARVDGVRQTARAEAFARICRDFFARLGRERP